MCASEKSTQRRLLYFETFYCHLFEQLNVVDSTSHWAAICQPYPSQATGPAMCRTPKPSASSLKTDARG